MCVGGGGGGGGGGGDGMKLIEDPFFSLNLYCVTMFLVPYSGYRKPVQTQSSLLH